MHETQHTASDSDCDHTNNPAVPQVDGAEAHHTMSDENSIDPRRPRYIPPVPARIVGSSFAQLGFETTFSSYELSSIAESSRQGRRRKTMSGTSSQSTVGLRSEQDCDLLGSGTQHVNTNSHHCQDLPKPENGLRARLPTVRACKSTLVVQDHGENQEHRKTHLQPRRAENADNSDRIAASLQSVSPGLGCDRGDQPGSLVEPLRRATESFETAPGRLADSFAQLDISQLTRVDVGEEPIIDSSSDTSWDEVCPDEMACIDWPSNESVEGKPLAPVEVDSRQIASFPASHAGVLVYPETEGGRNLRSCPSNTQTGSQGRSGVSTGRSGTSAVRRASSPNGRGSKRRMINDPNEDEDDTGQPGEHRSRSNTAPAGGKEKKYLACPYTKANSSPSFLHVQCLALRLTDIKAVKQHLQRQHKRPDHYCRRCSEKFELGDQATRHAREAECQVSEDKFVEKMTEDQWAKVHRKRPGEDTADGWYTIFKIIFPEKEPPLSPYRDSPHTLAVEHIARIIDFLGYQAFHDMCQRRRQEGYQLNPSTQMVIDEASQIEEASQDLDGNCLEYFDMDSYLVDEQP